MVHRWYEDQHANFNNPNHINLILKRDLPSSQASPMVEREIEAEALRTFHCMERFLAIAKQYPDTRLFIFNPPVLQQLLSYRAKPGLVEVWIRAQEMFAANLASVSNVKYFDFHAAADIENDCRRFMDAAHFDPAAGDQLVRWMHDGIFERTKEANQAISAAIRSAAAERVSCPPRS
jgi:hypothetical protein